MLAKRILDAVITVTDDNRLLVNFGPTFWMSSSPNEFPQLTFTEELKEYSIEEAVQSFWRPHLFQLEKLYVEFSEDTCWIPPIAGVFRAREDPPETPMVISVFSFLYDSITSLSLLRVNVMLYIRAFFAYFLHVPLP